MTPGPPGTSPDAAEAAGFGAVISLPDAPYPGLRAFQRDEWTIFFGRERMVDDVIERIGDSRFVVVHGPSGGGKSSLMQAGVIAQLQREHQNRQLNWRPAIMRPGNAPMWHLAAAVVAALGDGNDHELIARTRLRLNRRADGLADTLEDLQFSESQRLFILVDQFEEIFRFAEEGNTDEAKRFIDLLVDLHRRKLNNVYIALTMRSDHLGDCALFDGLAETVNVTQYLVPLMDERELRDAIQRPAAIYKGRVDDELADELIRASRHSADQLPLIQHALSYMWQLAKPDDLEPPPELTLAHYNQAGVGSVTLALSNHADSVLKTLLEADPENAATTERVFRALTQFDESGRAIRRRLTHVELLDEVGGERARLDEVVNAFSAAERSFLLIEEAGSERDAKIDISHESLIRHWRTLSDERLDNDGQPRGWVAREAADGRVWQSLVATVESTGDNADVYLPEAIYRSRKRWWDERNPTPAWAQRHGGRFDKVEDLYARSLVKMEEEQKRRRKERWLKRMLVSLAVVLTIGSIAATLYSLEQQKQLEAQKKTAVKALRAQWRYTVDAASDDDPSPGVDATTQALIALEFLPDQASAERRDLPLIDEAAQALRDALSHPIKRVAKLDLPDIQSHELSPSAAAFNRDGSLLAVGMYADTFVWDVATGESRASLSGDDSPVLAVALSPDGSQVAAAGYDNVVRLWDVAGQTLRESFAGHTDWIRSLAFSADGSLLASGSDDGDIRVWDVAGGNAHSVLEGHTDWVRGVAFSPDGSLLASAADDGNLRLWRVAGHAARRTSGDSSAGVPDDAESSVAQATGVQAYAVAWSADGASIAMALAGGRVLVLDSASLAVSHQLAATTPAHRLHFNAAGTALAALDERGRVTIWDLQTGAVHEPLTATVAGKATYALAWQPDDSVKTTVAVAEHLRVEVVTGRIDQTTLPSSTQALVEHVKRTLHRCLGDEERKTLRLGAVPDWCIQGRIPPYDGRGRLARGLAFLREDPPAIERAMQGFADAREQAPQMAAEIERRMLELLKERAFDYLTLEEDELNNIWDLAVDELQRRLAQSQALADRTRDPGWRGEWRQRRLKALKRWTLGNLKKGVASTKAIDSRLAAADRLAALIDRDEPGWKTELSRHRVRFLIDSGRRMLTNGLRGEARAVFRRALKIDPSVRERIVVARARAERAAGQVQVARLLALELDPDSDDTRQLLSELMGGTEPMRLLKGHEESVVAVAYSSDGRVIASSDDASIRIWDAATGELRHDFRAEAEALQIAFSHDGSLLAAPLGGNRVRVWDVVTGEIRETFIGHEDIVNSVSFSPDGQLLASASNDGSVRLWEVATGKARGMPLRHADEVNAVSFSPDGVLLATAANDGSARLWDVASGKLLQTLSGHEGLLLTVRFAPDGRHLASAGHDGKACIWAIESGEMLRCIEHADTVTEVAFSPDSRLLAASTNENGVRVWQINDATLLQSLNVEDSATYSVAWAASDGGIVTGSEDAVVRVFEAYNPGLMQRPLRERALHSVERCLTPKERADFDLSAEIPTWCPPPAAR